MHEESKMRLKEAVKQCLPRIQPLAEQFQEPYQVWERLGEKHWQGRTIQRTSFHALLRSAEAKIDESGRAFTESFFNRHPEYIHQISIAGDHDANLGRKPELLFRNAMRDFLYRHETFEADDEKVDALVGGLESFIDNSTVVFRFQAELINFSMDASAIEFSDLGRDISRIRIRRMTEKEVTYYCGGSSGSLGFVRPSSAGINEFCIEGEARVQITKSFEPPQKNNVAAVDHIVRLLDKMILSLRTFKRGHIGYDFVHFRSLEFCPITPSTRGCGDRYVPFGSYTLAPDEVTTFGKHAELIFDLPDDNAMEIACSRLADAETRTKPHDKIIDAVVGMEALLLHKLNAELSFRFALRYSTLFETSDEVRDAFRLGRDLYKLRSTVVHGGKANDFYQIGHEKLALSDAAHRAVESLRHLVRHFLPQAKRAPYKDDAFWENSILGLRDL